MDTQCSMCQYWHSPNDECKNANSDLLERLVHKITNGVSGAETNETTREMYIVRAKKIATCLLLHTFFYNNAENVIGVMEDDERFWRLIAVINDMIPEDEGNYSIIG